MIPGWAWDMILVSLCMAGALLVGAIIVALVKRWRREEDKPLSNDAQLAHFRSLYEQGEISAEEFQALRVQLLGLPSKQPAKAATTTPSTGVRSDLPEGTAPPEQPSPPPQSSPPPPDDAAPS
jgi:hypothetical protein